MRRLAPAFTLFLLAPLVAEFLLGNLPITMLPMLVLLAPLYGGGALLVRETARRLGRGWPTMVLFAAAYAVVEEGITTMSLFNPGYAGAHLMDSGYLPALGIAAPWTISVITLHVVWSISVPIAIVETLARDRRTEPWLGRPGLAVAALVFVFGCAGSLMGTERFWPYTLSTAQITGVTVTIAALITAGVLVGRPRHPRPTTRRAPTPWLLGTATLTAGLAFRLLPTTWNPWLTTTLMLTITTLAATTIWYSSTTTAWTTPHRLAAAAGPLLAYAILGFHQTPMLPAAPAVDLAGNAVFAAGALALLIITARRLPRNSPAERHLSRPAAGPRPG